MSASPRSSTSASRAPRNVGEGTLIGGSFAGKFNFVSPEQLGLRSRRGHGRSDIYSLGLVIAAALRGKPLDMGGTHVDVIEKRRGVPDLSGLDPSTAARLLQAMLAPDPAERPRDDDGGRGVAASDYLAAGARRRCRRWRRSGPRQSPFGACCRQNELSPFAGRAGSGQRGGGSRAATRPRGARDALAASLVALVLIGGAGAAYLGGRLRPERRRRDRGDEACAASDAETLPPVTKARGSRPRRRPVAAAGRQPKPAASAAVEPLETEAATPATADEAAVEATGRGLPGMRKADGCGRDETPAAPADRRARRIAARGRPPRPRPSARRMRRGRERLPRRRADAWRAGQPVAAAAPAPSTRRGASVRRRTRGRRGRRASEGDCFFATIAGGGGRHARGARPGAVAGAFRCDRQDA